MAVNPTRNYTSDEGVNLKEFSQSDWIAVHEYAKQPIVSEYQPWGPNKQEDSKLYVNQVIEDSMKEPRTRFAFAIIYHSNLVGAGELNIRSFTNKIGEISYIVHPDHWRKGIATQVSKQLINFGFKKRELHRIYATW